MRIASPDNRLFRAFGNWVIRRAMRTPYFHIHHQDDALYMGRWWSFRVGKNDGFDSRARSIRKLRSMIDGGRFAGKELRLAYRELEQLHEQQQYRWAGGKVHHIASSDIPVLHDHPWSFCTLILRGGYTEITPLTDDGVCLRRKHFGAGTFRFVRANQWHYLEVDKPDGAWTLCISFPKRQSWGFLVDGVKVPWRKYLADREAASKVASA
jgi:hypothetical protein